MSDDCREILLLDLRKCSEDQSFYLCYDHIKTLWVAQAHGVHSELVVFPARVLHAVAGSPGLVPHLDRGPRGRILNIQTFQDER